MMNNKKVNGMILAAGFGTRLREELGDIPKPLAELSNETTIIDNVLANYKKSNISNIAINLHHKKDEIKNYLLNKHSFFNFNFLIEKEILGTGGGIRNGKEFFKKADYTIVSNSDILYFFDFNRLTLKHINSKSPISLLVFKNKDNRGVTYNTQNRLTGFSGVNNLPLYGLDNYIDENDEVGTFTGIHIISKCFFEKKYFEKKSGFFSIIDVYVEMIKNNETINIIPVNNLYWNDIGTPKNYQQGKVDFKAFSFVENLFKTEIKNVKVAFKGASNKTVYQVNTENGKKVIATISQNKKELKAIFEFSKYLKSINFKVPHVFKVEDNFLISDNGGEKNLLQLTEKQGKLNEKYYQLAINEIIKLKKADLKKFPFKYCFQTDEFNLDNITFDIEYFNTWYLKSIFIKETIDKIGFEIYKVLKETELSIMHRDFQSTNILIKGENEINIVDIQTMRKGFPEYDLASLLYDSYIPFNEKFIENMLIYYNSFELLNKEVFYNCALIRLLQNLGAFSRFRNKDFFKDKLERCLFRINYLLNNKNKYFSEFLIKTFQDFF